jgi:hypothetical protein
MPENIIAMPVSHYYIATAGGKSHMWDAAVYFANEVVMPYLNGTLRVYANSVPPDSSVKTEVKARTNYDWLFYVFLAAVALWILSMALKSAKARRKMANPPFIAPERVPDPSTATQEQLRPLVQEAFGRVYGERNFDVIGDVQGGIIDGPQTIFFLDGSHQIQNFNEEDGFRARLRFKSNGVESLVVGKLGCFNLCWSAERSEFSGTFTPYGSNQPERIERISESQAGDIGENIRRIGRGEEAVVEPPPAAPVQEPPAASEPSESKKSDSPISLTEIQISDGRVTLKGDRINLSFGELMEVIREASPKSGAPEAKK